MKREKQKEIQWFLDFCSVEVGKLSEEERGVVASGVQRYTQAQTPKDPSERAPIRKDLMEFLTYLTDPKRLISLQKRIADFFGFMTWRMDNAQDIALKGWTLVEDTDFFPSLGRDRIAMDFDLKVEGLRYDQKTENGGFKKFRVKQESFKDAIISISYVSPIEAEASLFLSNFIRLIDGVPVTAFKKCLECGKWFVNLTKKERIYCSNNCAATKRQREGRLELNKKVADGDHEAIKKREIELEKSRARARKSYEKKVRDKQSNVKIKKNPRKPQWKEGHK